MIVVCDFVSNTYSTFSVQRDLKHPTDDIRKFRSFYPIQGNNSFRNQEHLFEQIEYKAIPIFEALYPDCIAMFAFDNSSNHAAFSKDALVASRMNLNPSGKQPVMRNTYFRPNNQLQSIIFPITYYDEKLNGKPKGIKQVPPGALILDCKECKEKIQDISRTTCCAR
ncbi:hypothetical protein RhiirA5_428748 [Rhizophagus irregularis]|uniref:Uncharacterized protein n=2 Tax=Rhizophagus irregularis TaxID=588596 RepID=A0A2N0NZR5_9GLOM|nr:hypothetical protein RhiirA5_428748 [Rhizophagus irregularis]CAB4479209.1 unnamed protein product [Rhizophagus irregularis]